MASGSLNMNAAAREQFLAELHVGVLGVERADGPPLVVPIWYGYTPGGDVEICMSAASLKGRLLKSAGRATLCAQQEALPYKYVSVEGEVTIEALGADAATAVEALAIRYLGEDAGKAYAAQGISNDEIRVSIKPDRWFSVDYGQA
jgi:PPOX class probable F420-dependent enzyme